MMFKYGHILFLLFFAKTFATNEEIETLDFDFFESIQNEPDKVVIDLKSSDPDIQLLAIKELQTLFIQNEYLNEFVENEHLPTLVKCLNSENTTIQHEAIKALSEVAKSSARNAKEVVREKAVPHFIRLYHSSNTSVAAQSIQIIKLPVSLEVLNETVRVMLILTIDKDRPLPDDVVERLLPTLKKLLHHTNPDILKHVTWAFQLLTVEENSRHDLYLDGRTIKILINLINHRNPNIQAAAIGVINNVVNEKNEQSKMVMDYGILKMLPKLLMHENDETVKDALSLLSKLFDVSVAQTTMIFDKEIIPLIILHLARVTNDEVQEEAAYTIQAATKFVNSKQISYMTDMNFINSMCKFLIKIEKKSNEAVEVALIGFHRFFSKSDDRLAECKQKFKKCGAIAVINRLKKNENQTIREISSDLARILH
uniref:Uncharacterized protein n=1 Tax=Panagrolaimus sp. ES5 TaxID=591445 RepID=A0AC34FUT2_9BILA